MRGALPDGWASRHGSGFVWLLAGAHQTIERFGGFDALVLLKLAALYYFDYFFLRHILCRERVVL